MNARLLPVLLIAAALLASCGESAPAPGTPRPGSLSVSVGGSVGTSGAMVSQPRTEARAAPR